MALGGVLSVVVDDGGVARAAFFVEGTVAMARRESRGVELVDRRMVFEELARFDRRI